MKKYLMIGFAAIAMASCTNHDFETFTQAQIDKAKYDEAFINYLGARPAANQNWGFGATTRAFTRAAAAGSTVATTNATLFSTWNDQKTYVTCDEEEAVLNTITYSVDPSHPISLVPEILTAYNEVLPEGVNNASKIASTNKEEFLTTEAGEISYVVLPGVTAGIQDRVGYYYYTTSGNIRTMHKYVLSNDPSASYIGDGTSYDVKNGDQYAYTVLPKRYKSFKLVYVDDNGNASYTFPAGLNVGFFIETSSYANTAVELYSRGSLNTEISNWLEETLPGTHEWANTASNSHAAIFSYGDFNFVGFEDWTDYDYNDIVLSVTGNITPAPEVNIEEEKTSDFDLRIIAEDLSATQASDFDFNDVVIDIKYGETAQIVLVAAGGTLPLRVGSKDGVGGVEVHEAMLGTAAMNGNVYKMINTGYGAPAGATADATDISSTISMKITNPAEANNLRIEVYKGGKCENGVWSGGTWEELTAPLGEPACKLAVDPDFKILSERQSIKKEYTKFVDWATENDPELSKWWK